MKNRKLIALLMLTITVRLAAVFILNRHIVPEAWEYDILAKNMLSGKGYVMANLHTDYRALGYPLYAFISAGIYFLTNTNYFALELLNIIASGFICYFVYAITKKIYNNNGAGLIAAFIFAVHPGLIVYATKLHELTLVAFFVCFVFWYLFICDTQCRKDDFFFGIFIGLGILLRPTLLFLLPAVILYRHIKFKPYIGKAICSFFVMAVICASVIMPWIIRNYMIHKQLTFITTSSAEHFWRGNNSFSTGTALTKDKKCMFEVAPQSFLRRLYSLNEIGQYNLFYSETKKFVQKNPGFFLRMIARKFCFFWWFSPQTGLTYASGWKYIYTYFYLFFAFFFLTGLFLSFASSSFRPYILPVCFFIAVVSLAHSFYYVETRHRWMVEPLMSVVAGFGVVNVVQYLLLKFHFNKGKTASHPV